MTDQALFDVVGRRAVLFRPPFGEYSVESVQAATRAGYIPIQYDAPSGDPDPNFYAFKLLESVLTQVKGGSIVVMHANGHGHHTVEALALIIDALRQRGFELTTVPDVMAAGPVVTDDGHKGPRRKPPAPPTSKRAAEPTTVDVASEGAAPERPAPPTPPPPAPTQAPSSTAPAGSESVP